MYDCKFAWPAGAHIAVVFNMSWETWEKKLGTSDNNQKSSERVPPHAKYGRGMRWIYEHAYAETGGMQRLLDLWRRHSIRTSTYADGHTVSLFPALAKAAAADGHEFLVQGWEHNYFWDMRSKNRQMAIDSTIAVFERTGDQMDGLQQPRRSSHGRDLSALRRTRASNIACGLRNVDVPFIIHVGDPQARRP